MRRIGLAAVLVLAAIAGGLAYLLLSIDGIVARAIEREGERLTGTDVSVGAVDIRVRAGRGSLQDFEIANPEGFSPEPALRLDDIALEIDPLSANESPLRLKAVEVGRVVAGMEFGAKGRSNLEEIRRHAAAQSPRPEPAGPAGEAPPAQRRVRIDRLEFEGGEILVRRPDREEPERVEFPAFTMRDLGGAQGATGGEIGVRVLQEVVRRAALATAGHELGRALEKELGEAGKAAGELIRDLFE